MTETSARFALPFILPGQAQKEAYHNEALTLLDAALHAAVEEAPLADPAGRARGRADAGSSAPARPAPGRARTARWRLDGGRLAVRRAGSRHAGLEQGRQMLAALVGQRLERRRACPPRRSSIGGQQVVGPRLPDVPSPSGGTIIDAEARAAIDALIATLKSHGLID